METQTLARQHRVAIRVAAVLGGARVDRDRGGKAGEQNRAGLARENSRSGFRESDGPVGRDVFCAISAAIGPGELGVVQLGGIRVSDESLEYRAARTIVARGARSRVAFEGA